MSSADGLKGTTGSVDIRNEMLPPRLDGKVKPLPPLPAHVPAEKENVKNLAEPRERRENEGTDRNASLPVAPPKPDPLTEPKADDGGGTLQRSKPANMKEKVEKWRERRSDIENFRISKLK